MVVEEQLLTFLIWRVLATKETSTFSHVLGFGTRMVLEEQPSKFPGF